MMRRSDPVQRVDHSIRDYVTDPIREHPDTGAEQEDKMHQASQLEESKQAGTNRYEAIIVPYDQP